MSLPVDGAADILSLLIETTVPEPVEGACDPTRCELSYVDGLVGVGGGQPVNDTVIFIGFGFTPATQGATISVCPEIPEGGLQKPGDENQDGKLDISDAVALLNFLFLGGPPPKNCLDDKCPCIRIIGCPDNTVGQCAPAP